MSRPLPDPTALRHTRTYKRVYAFISACYLLFSLFQIALTQESNFYQLLGVGVDANQSGLKSAYRSLAKQFHPDRAGARSAEVFMRARKGYEVLMDPTARFAYDRFGPLALSFGDIHSEREYLRAGLLQCTAFYACSILAMMAYAMFGDSNSGGAKYHSTGILYHGQRTRRLGYHWVRTGALRASHLSSPSYGLYFRNGSLFK
ncbi:hypothetical protein FRB99_008961 [Tulasnella sp. 403]|nr:hypothetical protein FRB99_008961 [Tulasnella sp. 403]